MSKPQGPWSVYVPLTDWLLSARSVTPAMAELCLRERMRSSRAGLVMATFTSKSNCEASALEGRLSMCTTVPWKLSMVLRTLGSELMLSRSVSTSAICWTTASASLSPLQVFCRIISSSVSPASEGTHSGWLPCGPS